MIIKDTFEKQYRSLVRRVGLLERRVGRGGSTLPTAHAVDFYNGEGEIATGTTTRVNNWGAVRTSGTYLYAGTYSVGVARSAWYEAVGSIRWATGQGRRQVRITLETSGDSIAYVERAPGTVATFDGMTATSGPVFIEAGENIALYGWQSSGGNLGYSSFLGRVGTYLRVRYIGEDAP